MTGLSLWFTGLPCSGKTTLGDAVKRLHDARVREGGMGIAPMARLDGDRFRLECRGRFGFSADDRLRNLMLAAREANMLMAGGQVVACSFIVPTEDLRGAVSRTLAGRCLWIWTRCPLEVCEARDDKGMYAQARAGAREEFTGISAPFEPPRRADLVLDTHRYSVTTCAESVFHLLLNAMGRHHEAVLPLRSRPPHPLRPRAH